MKTYTVILGDRTWKHGGKRKHRTFTIEAESRNAATQKALGLIKLDEGVSWKPDWAQAREVALQAEAAREQRMKQLKELREEKGKP